jgi:hypothetical protein
MYLLIPEMVDDMSAQLKISIDGSPNIACRNPTKKLAYQEPHPSKEAAFRREMYFKSGNGRRALSKLLS